MTHDELIILSDLRKAVDSIAIQLVGKRKNYAGYFNRCKKHDFYMNYPRLNEFQDDQCPCCLIESLASDDVKRALGINE